MKSTGTHVKQINGASAGKISDASQHRSVPRSVHFHGKPPPKARREEKERTRTGTVNSSLQKIPRRNGNVSAVISSKQAGRRVEEKEVHPVSPVPHVESVGGGTCAHASLVLPHLESVGGSTCAHPSLFPRGTRGYRVPPPPLPLIHSQVLQPVRGSRLYFHNSVPPEHHVPFPNVTLTEETTCVVGGMIQVPPTGSTHPPVVYPAVSRCGLPTFDPNPPRQIPQSGVSTAISLGAPRVMRTPGNFLYFGRTEGGGGEGKEVMGKRGEEGGEDDGRKLEGSVEKSDKEGEEEKRRAEEEGRNKEEEKEEVEEEEEEEEVKEEGGWRANVADAALQTSLELYSQPTTLSVEVGGGRWEGMGGVGM